MLMFLKFVDEVERSVALVESAGKGEGSVARVTYLCERGTDGLRETEQGRARAGEQ